jgi:hypothetical protein
LDTMPSQPSLQACANRMSPSPSKNSFQTIPGCGPRTSFASLRLRSSIGQRRKSSPSSAIRSKAISTASSPWRDRRFLEVRPRHEDDGSRAERQEQHDAEVEFYSLPSLLSSIHLSEISGATARARCSTSGLRIMSLSGSNQARLLGHAPLNFRQ